MKPNKHLNLITKGLSLWLVLNYNVCITAEGHAVHNFKSCIFESITGGQTGIGSRWGVIAHEGRHVHTTWQVNYFCAQ